jgi:8-oxo-dGTP pyrophosphatase MutT (NUDIX family)
MYAAEKFVESAGTVLFRLSTREVCILHLLHRDEYILPKGRRNLGESRRTTAIRETTEETDIPCRLLPVNLVSRVCRRACRASWSTCTALALSSHIFGLQS